MRPRNLNEIWTDAEALAELAREPLLAELEPYLEQSESLGGKILRHPLVFSIPFAIPGVANMQYEAKLEALEKAVENKDWGAVLGLHERPYRCRALIDYVVGRDEDWRPRQLKDQPPEVRSLAAGIWTDSENIEQCIDDWDCMFSGWEPGEPPFMLEKGDMEAFEALPDPITVYRGDCPDGGWSWTLDRRVAEFFAQRFGNYDLLEGTAPKSHVFGYLKSRREEEVLIRREHVHDIKILRRAK